MNTKHTNSVRAFVLHPVHGDQANAAAPLTLEQSMTRKHVCPCCSYPLLRHIRSGEVIWECDHCYTSVGVYVRSQPVITPQRQAKKRPVFISVSSQPLSRKPRNFLFSHLTNQRQLAMDIMGHRLRLARTKGLVFAKLAH
jgi:ribosomal protein L37AE/L43A